jgi:hypothetical protein
MESSPPPPSRLWDGYRRRDSLSRAAPGLPSPAPEPAPPNGVAGAPGAHQAPQGPSRLGPEASSPVAAPGSAAQASASVRTSAKPSRSLLHSRVHLGLGVPCTPRHSPGYAYPPLGPGGRPCPGKIDLDSNRGSRQVLHQPPPPEPGGVCGGAVLDGWPLPRRRPRSPESEHPRQSSSKAA